MTYVINETVKHEIKTQEGGYLCALLAPLAASLVQPVISSVVKGISGRVVRRGDILINELRVTSYKLISLRVAFIARVTSYELLLIARVTSYCLLYELRDTVYCTSYELLFAYELRLNFYMRVTSYFLTVSYNKDKDDKAVYDNKVKIKNYPFRSFLIKNLELAKPHFCVISI